MRHVPAASLAEIEALLLRRLADGDALAKALLLLSRAEGKIAIDLEFRQPRQWPDLEPPAEADRIFREFAEQGPSGQVILATWRNKARALVGALLAQLAHEPAADAG